MRRLRIGILDLVTKSPNPSLYGRVMNANLASIMPQVVGVWCEQEGHQVQVVCYTGMEDLLEELPSDLDLVFIGAFTQSAQLAYALSNFFQQAWRGHGAGRPPRPLLPGGRQQVLRLRARLHRPEHHRRGVPGVRPAPAGRAARRGGPQPLELPTLEERWKFVEPTLAKAPTIKIVPMIGSLGCPYTCSFCIDSTVDYQPLSFGQLRDDLKFLLTKIKNPIVGWHDPNFGVRFDDYMEAVEAAVPEGRIRHIAESSLSLLSEKHLQRLRKNGFRAILPGIESWYDLGNKSKTRRTGMDKVKLVSEHVNMILRYIPYIQTNFVMGLDGDMGPEPFELTKKFIDLSPGAFPAYSLLSAFGRAAPMNLEYQRAGRVLPFPFHFLNNNHAMNVRPKNYSWPEFYDAPGGRHPLLVLLEGHRPPDPGDADDDPEVDECGAGGLIGGIRPDPLSRDHPAVCSTPTDRCGATWKGKPIPLPEFYAARIRRELGPAYEFLPEGALYHDPNAYLHATTEPAAQAPVQLGGPV